MVISFQKFQTCDWLTLKVNSMATICVQKIYCLSLSLNLIFIELNALDLLLFLRCFKCVSVRSIHFLFFIHSFIFSTSFWILSFLCVCVCNDHRILHGFVHKKANNNTSLEWFISFRPGVDHTHVCNWTLSVWVYACDAMINGAKTLLNSISTIMPSYC